MECAKLLNVLGLILGLIGVIIIFIWGPPQPDLKEGISRITAGQDVVENDIRVKRERKRYNIMSKIGLGLVFFGFVFQLVGTCVK